MAAVADLLALLALQLTPVPALMASPMVDRWISTTIHGRQI